MTEPTRRQIARGCRHFNGIQHDDCKAGVAYKQFFDSHQQLPCIPHHDGALNGLCPVFAFCSEEEIQEEEHQRDATIAKFLKDLEDDICPHCGVKITHKRQVGRCVYADPCGHRLYQGKLPREKTDYHE